MRVLVFGASITQGFWDSQGGWVNRLRKYYDGLALKDLKLQDNYPTIFNLGISGNKVEDLLARFDGEASARLRADTKNGAIIFSIGTNNAYTEGEEKWSGPGSYRSNLEELVQKAKKYTDKIMFVGLPPCEEDKTTPVFWRDITYTNDRILAVDKIMREVAANHSFPQVATFEPLRDEMEKGKQLFADGLHPNNDGHELIFRLVQPELDKLLPSK